MNKLCFWLSSCVISILTIFISLCLSPESFLCWLAFVLLIFIIPVLLYNFCKLKQKSILIIQAIILYSLLVPAWCHIFKKDNYYIVAATKNNEKANKIQEFLTSPTRQTHRFIIFDEDNNPSGIGVAVDNAGKKNNYKITLELLNSSIVDDSVIMQLNLKHTKNRTLLVKRVSNELRNIIYNIDGVKYVFIDIKLPKGTSKNQASFEQITVNYELENNADNKKVKTLIEKLIIPAFKDKGTIIKINDLTQEKEVFKILQDAQEEFEQKNYAKSVIILEKVKSIDYKTYIVNVEKINKIIELNSKIKNSTNYKYFIELGDLQSSSEFHDILIDYFEAINNYKKALQLNPKADEVYEKIGNAYYALSCNHKLSYGDKKLYRNKAIEYYLKSLEFSKGSRNVYENLGKIYRNNKDYSKSLESYNKIDTSGLDSLYLEEVSNNKVYLNWKLGNLKEAYKETADCSVWICKLVRFNF